MCQFLKIAAAVVTDEKSWIRNRMVRFTVRTSTSVNDEQVERPPVYGAICIKLTLPGNYLLYRHLDMMYKPNEEREIRKTAKTIIYVSFVKDRPTL